MTGQASNLLKRFLAATLFALGGLIAGSSGAGAATAAEVSPAPAAEKAAGKAGEKTAEKTAEKAAEKPAEKAAEKPAEKLDSAGCLKCHDGKKEKLEVPARDGKMRPLLAIDPGKYRKSVHARMSCVDCHVNITDNESPHKITATLKDDCARTLKVDCARCHEALWDAAVKDGTAKDKPRLEKVIKNAQAYANSFHARPDRDDPSRPKAVCEQCHDTHTFAVPAKKGSPEDDAWRETVPDLCGKSCHEDQLDDYNKSVHGVELIEGKNAKSAECADCHSIHDIAQTSATPTKLVLTKNCGNCHEKQYQTFRDTYHGQVTTLGYGETAKCFNCHGSHGILKVDDPKSKMHPDNRLKTCKKCHDGKKRPEATAGFISFGPHANDSDFERYPQVSVVSLFMKGLLLSVFAFFWVHSSLWWYREYKDRKEGKGHPHVRTLAALGIEAEDKHVRRFGLLWRIGHLCFALSLMTLVLTGMTLFYAETAWAPVVARALGGPAVMGIVHRTAASVFVGVFLLHLIGVSVNITRSWKTFTIFGADSLVPRWQDLKDAVGMFQWFVGKAPRPTFDRWTYWEKFDYWAPFWGVVIIGFSGLMLWFPSATASVLPGWVFNVASVVHGEEAFLAAVYLFTVHFVNSHFRPDKLPPPDLVMFTGVQSLEEFRREHSAQYTRLVESGELEKYLVDAPSRPMTLASKILGRVLIVIGLTLLVLIAIGFFGGR